MLDTATFVRKDINSKGKEAKTAMDRTEVGESQSSRHGENPPQLQLVARDSFHIARPRMLPAVHNPLVYCRSRVVRSGFEFLGDRALYVMTGLGLMRLVPHLAHRYAALMSALTSNQSLGELVVIWGLARRTDGKGGGDACETLLGALVKSYSRRGFWEILDVVVEILRQPILACAAALTSPKRKHLPEPKQVNTGSDKTVDTEPRHKRRRIDAASSSSSAPTPPAALSTFSSAPLHTTSRSFKSQLSSFPTTFPKLFAPHPLDPTAAATPRVTPHHAGIRTSTESASDLAKLLSFMNFSAAPPPAIAAARAPPHKTKVFSPLEARNLFIFMDAVDLPSSSSAPLAERTNLLI